MGTTGGRATSNGQAGLDGDIDIDIDNRSVDSSASPASAPVDGALAVLLREERFAVVAKPSGLMVHDSKLARGETDFAADRLREQFQQPIFLVHRLDRATSGCLLLAFDREAASALGKSLMAHAVVKDYLAICRGWTDAEFQVDHELDGGPGKPLKKSAQTQFVRLAQGELPIAAAGFETSRFSLLRARPLTGRFRQIRRHLKHADHHLIGDTSHGDGRRNRAFRMLGVHRMLLHAWQLHFPHPFEDREISVQAPPDGEFVRAMNLFEWSLDGIESQPSSVAVPQHATS
jgi:tRNA pseudouridine65 synthase